MKRTVILSCLLMLLLSAASQATETRVLTMGENNMVLLDEANIFMFPSRLNEYPSLVVGEFDSDDFSEFGVHWKLGKSENPWYLATYLHNNSRSVPELWENPFYSFLDTVSYGENLNIPFDDPSFMNSNKRIDLLYGRALGKSQFGFHFGMVHSSKRNDFSQSGFGIDGKDNEALSLYKVQAGFTFNEGLLDIAAGLDILSYTDKGTDSTGVAFIETKGNGNSKLHFLARSFYEYSPQYTFIPHVGVSYAKYEGEYYDQNIDSMRIPIELDSTQQSRSILLVETHKFKRTVFDIGIGAEYVPANNVLVVLDFGVKYDKLRGEFFPEFPFRNAEEASRKTVTFPYFKIGFDADVFKWMDVRFGATSYWDNETIEDVTRNGEVNMRYPSNATYLGFGFHWNRLHIDTQTDPDLFLRGFDFVNGKENNSRDMNIRLSAVYDWN